MGRGFESCLFPGYKVLQVEFLDLDIRAHGLADESVSRKELRLRMGLPAELCHAAPGDFVAVLLLLKSDSSMVQSVTIGTVPTIAEPEKHPYHMARPCPPDPCSQRSPVILTTATR